jgi:hypothetical protein
MLKGIQEEEKCSLVELSFLNASTISSADLTVLFFLAKRILQFLVHGREGLLSIFSAPGLHWHLKGLPCSSTHVPSWPQSMAKQAETKKKKRKIRPLPLQDKRLKLIRFWLCRFRNFTVKCNIAAQWRLLDDRAVAAWICRAFNERNRTVEWRSKQIVHCVIGTFRD